MKKGNPVFLAIILIIQNLYLSSGMSSVGSRFVLGFPRNDADVNGPLELSISIVNYESNCTNFAITAVGLNSTGTLPPFSTARVTVPLSFQVISESERNKGIRVETTGGNVSVHGLSYGGGTSDSYLALPCLTMPVNEYEYFAISYDLISGVGSLYPATILVVTCEDATAVTIGSTSLMLNSMETYLNLSNTTDLTGTRITSSKPVSVFSGVDCANVPADMNYCDHLVEQVPPTVTWGSRFFVSSLNGRNSSQMIRALSSQIATVTVSCSQATISHFELTFSGNFQTFEIPVDSYCSIESTGPVLVAQYAYGGQLVDGVGGPFMMIIPPIEQYINRYIFETYVNFDSFFTVYVSLDFFDTTKILLNDNVIPDWQPVPCSSEPICGYIAKVSVAQGLYRIQHQNISAVIGVSVYGFAHDNSYGMPAGMGLSPIQVSTCPPLTAPTNGSVTYTSAPNGNGSFPFDTMATFSCNDSFSLVGGNVFICAGDYGFVDVDDAYNELPACQAITCPVLSDLVYGSLTYSDDPNQNNSYAFNSVATYSCDTGFSLVGNSSRTCTGDGSSATGAFDGQTPTCEVIICVTLTSVPAGGSGIITGVLTGNGDWEFGAEAIYSCDTGFSLVGNDTRTCTGNGSSTIGAFDGVVPTCDAIFCLSLNAPVNGSLTYTSAANENDSYSFNSVATYSCDTGFSLVGKSNRTCTGDGISSSGAFDGVTPTCEAITCPFLPDIADGSLSYSSTPDKNGNYAFNVMATYSCDTGFVLMGDAVRICTGDGSSVTGDFYVAVTPDSGNNMLNFSDGIAPACTEISCPFLSNLVNGSLTYSGVPNQNNSYALNVVATYSCDAGFSLVGNSSRTCTGDGGSTIGAFDGEAPTCEAVSSSASFIETIVVPVVGVVCGLSLVLLVGAVYGYIRVLVQLCKKRKQDSGNMKLVT